MSSCSQEDIKRPPFEEPTNNYIQHNSVIQIPITIDTNEIKQAILSEVKNPLSIGITKKITTDIMATEEIPTQEFKKSFRSFDKQMFKPFEATYQYISKDVTQFIDKTFKVGMWVKHKVYLTNLEILFQGSDVKIFTSYRIDLALDYEQSLIPLTKAMRVKGLLSGVIEAKINLVGKISINEKAELQIEASESDTKIKFTKILLPAAIDALDFLKITQTEDILTKKLLEEPINKYIFKEVQKQISKKQVDIKLAQKIQKLVYENSSPLALSKDLWLIPEAKKISISQVNGEGDICSNRLTINVGIIAKPELITSTSKPIVHQAHSIPIICKNLSPKVYLYPSLNIKYDFVENMIEEDLQNLIDKEYTNSHYSIKNVKIYPSKDKLVIAIDLIDKKDTEKIATFYLWGTPKLNRELMNISLEDFDYTIESRSFLIDIADWMLDAKIKNLIHKEAIFSYKEDFEKLSSKLSTIKHESSKKIITGRIDLVGIEDVFTSKDSIVVHALATGTISYKINLKE